jgi:hypothetical protein
VTHPAHRPYAAGGAHPSVRNAVRWPRRLLALALPLVTLTSFVLATDGTASATPTSLYAQTFTDATAAGVVLPSAPDQEFATNDACLSAGDNGAALPVPGCDLPTPDASGAGALRLTSAADSQEGGVFYGTSFPTQQGLDITFHSYQYGGTGADGIGFILAAANPSDPAPPTAIGSPGGALGYTPNTESESGSGLTDGYLGVGLDVYGNWTNNIDDGSGCTSDPAWVGHSARVLGQVTVRGPGNGSVGYCPLTSTAATDGGAPIALEGTTRANADVPVEVAINPGTAPVAMQQNPSVMVPAGSYAVVFTDLSHLQHTLSGPLPSTTNGQVQPGTIPASWINPATGIPDQLTFGWVASTGAANDIHEITTVAADTLSGAPVLFNLTNTDSGGGQLASGASATWTLVPSTLSTGAAETQPVSLTDSFPSGVTITSAGGTGWTCSHTALTVSCTDAASATNPIPNGTTLPSVTVTATVTATSGAPVQSTALVSSADGNPAQATDDDVVTLSPTMTGQADVLSLSASLLGRPLISPELEGSTGAVSTQSNSSTKTPCQLNPIITGVLVSGDLCAGVTTSTGTDTSTAEASIANLAVGVTTLPAIVLQGVDATSSTTCASSKGSVTISYLRIGTTVVIAKPTAVAPNTTLLVGPLIVVLNQQRSFTTPDKGLTVNAVSISLAAAGLAQINLVAATAESDISGCRLP